MKQERNDAPQHHAANFVKQSRVHGKNPVVIGTGGDAEIHIGHVGDNYAPQFSTVRYLTEKTLQTRISVPAMQKAATWTCWIAGLGLVANVLGILGWFGMSGPVLAVRIRQAVTRLDTCLNSSFIFALPKILALERTQPS